MTYVDTHCHLDQILEKTGAADYAELRRRYFPPDFEACITIACDREAFGPTLELLGNDGVYGAFGIHPHEAETYTPEVEARLLEALAHPKCVAFGEMGLDYHYDLSPRDRQREVFARQIGLALAADKPLVVHTREAEEDTLAVMREHVPRDWRVHVHCFTSSRALAEALLADFPRLCIGFTGIVTFKNAQDLRDTARVVPLDRLLVETDGPYLAPEPYRGKPAHPGHIPRILEKLAEVKGVSVEELARAARENTRILYGI